MIDLLCALSVGLGALCVKPFSEARLAIHLVRCTCKNGPRD